MSNVPCTKCGGSGLIAEPIPEENRRNDKPSQWNLSFPSDAERDACKELARQGRDRKGVKGRIQAGPIVSEMMYGFLNGLGPEDWDA